MQDYEYIKEEVEYWLQIIDDQKKSIDDLEKLNELILDHVLDPATVLLGFCVGEPKILDQVQTLIHGIKPIQDKIVALLERERETGRLIEGRFVMLKEESGL